MEGEGEGYLKKTGAVGSMALEAQSHPRHSGAVSLKREHTHTGWLPQK